MGFQTPPLIYPGGWGEPEQDIRDDRLDELLRRLREVEMEAIGRRLRGEFQHADLPTRWEMPLEEAPVQRNYEPPPPPPEFDDMGTGQHTCPAITALVMALLRNDLLLDKERRLD